MKLASLAVALLLLAGCGTAHASSGGFDVTVEFADALDVEAGAPVTVDGAPVGVVRTVSLSGFTARVGLRLDGSVQLPDNATAEIRQVSVLGGKSVALARPDGAVGGRLAQGDVIPLARTGHGLGVEEALSAFAVLLSGGGLEQLQTISRELTAALDGRDDGARRVLHELDRFVAGLDGQRADIVRAIDGLDTLTRTLAAQRATITTAVDSIGPGLRVLADQRKQLTGMLAALAKLGEVGGQVVAESRDATLADLRALAPIVAQLERAGAALPGALELLASYPFPRGAAAAVQGGMTNLYVTADPGLGAAVPAGPRPGQGAPPATHPPAPVRALSPARAERARIADSSEGCCSESTAPYARRPLGPGARAGRGALCRSDLLGRDARRPGRVRRRRRAGPAGRGRLPRLRRGQGRPVDAHRGRRPRRAAARPRRPGAGRNPGGGGDPISGRRALCGSAPRLGQRPVPAGW